MKLTPENVLDALAALYREVQRLHEKYPEEAIEAMRPAEGSPAPK